MLALTDYLGQPVFDRADVRVGAVADLAARLGGPRPRITRLLVGTGRRRDPLVMGPLVTSRALSVAQIAASAFVVASVIGLGVTALTGRRPGRAGGPSTAGARRRPRR